MKRSPHYPPPRDRRAFTLTELLVALAIIVVLSSLLLTGIHAARKSARAATCVSNLRQIHTYAKLWSVENQGLALPSAGERLSESDNNYFFWRRLLLNLIDPSFNRRDIDSARIMRRMDAPDYAGIMWCPSYVADHGQEQHVQGRGSYSINHYFRLLSTVRVKEVALAEAKEPWFICASTYPGYQPKWGAHHSFSTLTENSSLGGYGGAAYLHGGRGNVIFYDGHVTSGTPQELGRYEADVRDRSNF